MTNPKEINFFKFIYLLKESTNGEGTERGRDKPKQAVSTAKEINFK